MTIAAARSLRLLAAGAALAAACSSGHKPAACKPTIAVPAGQPFAFTASDCQAAPAVPAQAPFTLSGTVTYDFVEARYDPATGKGGLDFAAAQQRPVRGAQVEIRQCTTVLATTATDEAGHYSATFTPGATGRIYVTVLARTASPPIQVQDNTDGDAIWAVGRPLDAASPALDVRATHGFNGCEYTAWRIAAPFAILDSLSIASHRLMDLRTVPFDTFPLGVNWSPLNVPFSGSASAGRIGFTHYDPSTRKISVLGADGIDTDEYDREVVVHEWGHYFTDSFSRDDSPGGPHGLGDLLDPRLAFSEGFASGFAAVLLDQRVYADTFWDAGGLDAFGWDVETAPPPSAQSGANPADDPSPGPFSELSVIRSFWDLYDDSGTAEGWDAVAIGIGAIYDALVGPQRSTPALTTIASFVAGLKAQPGVSGPGVDAVLAHYAIGPITAAFGDGDTALRALYLDIPEPTATPASLTATFDGRFASNERPQNQYYVFTGKAATRVLVTSTSAYDVDLEAYDDGQLVAGAAGPSGDETIRDASNAPGFAITSGHTYVVVLTGWGGISSLQSGVKTYPATVTFTAQ